MSTKTLDPTRGDFVTLPELAERHDLVVNTLQYRYRNGKRGEELIRPPMTAKQKAAMRRAHLAEAGKGRGAPTAEDRARTIAQVLTDPSNYWLARPLRANA